MHMFCLIAFIKQSDKYFHVWLFSQPSVCIGYLEFAGGIGCWKFVYLRACKRLNHESIHTKYQSINFLEYSVYKELCKIGPSASSVNIQIFPYTHCLIYIYIYIYTLSFHTIS